MHLCCNFHTHSYYTFAILGACDFFVCFCQLAFRGFASLRIEALSNFGKYLTPFVVPASVITLTAEIYFVVFLSFERYLAICRQKRVDFRKTYYVIGFILLFSLLINVGVFWLYGVGTEINIELNCDKTFYLWVMTLPQLLFRFLTPLITMLVTSILTIKQVSELFYMYILFLFFPIFASCFFFKRL